jgi:RHS repeat-associated protein
MPEINFFWDPLSDSILQERDETGAVTAEYTAEPGLYGNIISQNRIGVERQFHYDAQGSTLAVTDDNQNVTDTFAYSAFGEATERTGTTEVPFQYIGKKGYFRDGLTGQYLVRRRPFEPVRARWLDRDPIRSLGFSVHLRRWPRFVELGQLSEYVYCFNRPLFAVDSAGEDPECDAPKVPTCWGQHARWRRSPTDADVCEYRSNERTDYEPATNECTGVPGGGYFGWWSFAEACNEHDKCYGQCAQAKTDCDDALRRAIEVECNRVWGTYDFTTYLECLASANAILYGIEWNPPISQRSWELYREEQDKACKFKPCKCPPAWLEWNNRW